jgi:hypothetical protein
MSVTHTTAARNAATDAVTALIGASGHLKFRLAGTVAAPGTIVANLVLSATAFGASASGTATANAITSDTNATGNATAVANGSLQTSAGTLVIHFDVGAQVTTSITGSASTDTVTVGSATGLAIGMKASGTGIATNARITDIQGTTIHLSIENSGAVSGTGTFDYDANMTNGLTVNAGDTVSCSSLTYTALIA